ncbi:hypothetical protein C2S53_009950 [Perilla frutescens var. hirtella]|uniref:Uncharacterized protein n=1 Tax=Perilla frutescens var. hirtella TaxID=608512 RepID=A0AAD4J6Y8_PERFH|nr:hypothetical protein C2S53_009950 [Perilla frutescens var. hirtella]
MCRGRGGWPRVFPFFVPSSSTIECNSKFSLSPSLNSSLDYSSSAFDFSTCHLNSVKNLAFAIKRSTIVIIISSLIRLARALVISPSCTIKGSLLYAPDLLGASPSLSGGVGGLDLEGSTVMMLAHEVSSAITTTFMRNIHLIGYSWKLLLANVRIRYFKEFKKEFICDPAITPMISGLWNAKAAVSPKVIKKAEISSKNRMSEPIGPGTGIVKYKSRSRCAHAHAAALGEVHETIEKRSQLPPDSSKTPPDMTSIYIDVIGVEKRRVFGLGNRAIVHIGCSQSSSSADSVGSQYYDSKAAIQELKAKMQAQE